MKNTVAHALRQSRLLTQTELTNGGLQKNDKIHIVGE